MPWIFRSSDPLVERLLSESSTEWPAEQHTSLMSPGDLVLMWEGGVDGNVVAVGRLQTQAYRSRDDMRKMIVRVGMNLVLASPLSGDECRGDAILGDLPVFKRPGQSNYGLSRAHADRLVSIIASRDPGFAEALNLPPDRFPAVEAEPAGEEPAVTVVETPASTPQAVATRVRMAPDAESRAQAFRESDAFRVGSALRRGALARLRDLIVLNVLAEITLDRFADEFARFGHVTMGGDDISWDEAVERLAGVSPEEVARQAASGAIAFAGTLTWDCDIAAMRREVADENAAALRLRAALSHLLNEERPLKARVARLRRSFGSLWPEAATGILMARAPEEHLVFHGPALDGLKAIGVDELSGDRLEDYERYLVLAGTLREQLGFDSFADLEIFLAHESGRGGTSARPTSGDAGDTESDDAAQSDVIVGGVTMGSQDAAPAPPNEGQAIFALYQHLRHAGVVAGLEEIANLYLCLKTVPMMALQGPSGSGKNLIMRSIAEAIGASFHWMPMTNESGHGPADAPIRLRDLLGSLDPSSGEFLPEPWFDALIEARDNPDHAVLLCVDTSDGWQEEPWFAEYARLQDSRRRDADGNMTTEPFLILPGREEVRAPSGRVFPAGMSLPDNLFMVMTTVGDVGLGDIVAEHTNVVEIGPINLDLDALDPGHAPEVITTNGLGTLLVASRPHRSLRSILDREWVETWNDEIEDIAGIVGQAGVSIGYRLRDEMLRFMAYAEDMSRDMPYGTHFPHAVAFDYQLAQRVVPKLMIRESEDDVLNELLMYAQGDGGNRPRFPRSVAQIEALQSRLD